MKHFILALSTAAFLVSCDNKPTSTGDSKQPDKPSAPQEDSSPKPNAQTKRQTPMPLEGYTVNIGNSYGFEDDTHDVVNYYFAPIKSLHRNEQAKHEQPFGAGAADDPFGDTGSERGSVDPEKYPLANHLTLPASQGQIDYIRYFCHGFDQEDLRLLDITQTIHHEITKLEKDEWALLDLDRKMVILFARDEKHKALNASIEERNLIVPKDMYQPRMIHTHMSVVKIPLPETLPGTWSLKDVEAANPEILDQMSLLARSGERARIERTLPKEEKAEAKKDSDATPQDNADADEELEEEEEVVGPYFEIEPTLGEDDSTLSMTFDLRLLCDDLDYRIQTGMTCTDGEATVLAAGLNNAKDHLYLIILTPNIVDTDMHPLRLPKKLKRK